MSETKPLFLILLLTLIIHASSTDVATPHPIETYCNSNTTTVTYQTATKTLLSALTVVANNSIFHNASVGSFVFGLYLCNADVSQSTCKDCVAFASAALPRVCPRGKDAAIWYDACMIRYSEKPFFGHVDNGFNATVLTDTGMNTSFNVEYQRRVNSVVATAAGAAATEAAFGGGTGKFATKDTKYEGILSVHVAAECTPDLGDDDCYRCLVECIGKLPTCCNTEGARALFLSCNLGYEVRKLYNKFAPASAPTLGISEMKRGRSNEHILQIAAVSISVLILLSLLSSLWLCIYRKKKTKQVYEEDVSDIIEVESLLMEFNMIRAATQNFASERKLGQGGFGQVYKGILENGQEIAVKRLSINSGQGVAEFKTEVRLVAKLQHRNLVKLLGFCISGKERILVYEFLSNSSLDKILFDPTKKMSLNWETRFKIVSGIAKGLLYLHEDSRLKIVHRDLKSSNILLDEAMNPKIADFGLAKLFGVDQTQDATSTIAGTYGYMAPEYIFTGRYSVKSDVYSFGIMVLEVVSGQRNYMSRPRNDEALLHQAWRLWNESSTSNLVDETLGDKYSNEEVLKCVHIGLLCAQENDARRPNMTTVVAALSGQAIALPLPTPPSYYGATDSTSSENTSYSVNRLEKDASVGKTSDITELHSR